MKHTKWRALALLAALLLPAQLWAQGKMVYDASRVFPIFAPGDPDSTHPTYSFFDQHTMGCGYAGGDFVCSYQKAAQGGYLTLSSAEGRVGYRDNGGLVNKFSAFDTVLTATVANVERMRMSATVDFRVCQDGSATNCLTFDLSALTGAHTVYGFDDTELMGPPTSSDGELTITKSGHHYDFTSAGIHKNFSLGAVDPSAACTAGSEDYTDTTAGTDWGCVKTDTWGRRVLSVGSGTATINPGEVTDGTCSSAIDGGTATGVATTDVISWTWNADPTGTTGYDPSGSLVYIVAYPTADHVNFKVCNASGGAVTPGSTTVNWRVAR